MLRAGGNVRESCAQRYLYPEPRVRLGTLLARNRVASACIDLSDGLADGVRRIAGASAVGIRIDAGLLPVGPDAREWFESRAEDPVAMAVDSGDDYELLFTSRPRWGGRLRTALKQAGVAVTRVGICTAETDVVIEGAAGPAAMLLGYKHFG